MSLKRQRHEETRDYGWDGAMPVAKRLNLMGASPSSSSSFLPFSSSFSSPSSSWKAAGGGAAGGGGSFGSVLLQNQTLVAKNTDLARQFAEMDGRAKSLEMLFHHKKEDDIAAAATATAEHRRRNALHQHCLQDSLKENDGGDTTMMSIDNDNNNTMLNSSSSTHFYTDSGSTTMNHHHRSQNQEVVGASERYFMSLCRDNDEDELMMMTTTTTMMMVLMALCIGLDGCDFAGHRFVNYLRRGPFKPKTRFLFVEAQRRYELFFGEATTAAQQQYQNYHRPQRPSDWWTRQHLIQWLERHPIQDELCKKFLHRQLCERIYGIAEAAGANSEESMMMTTTTTMMETWVG